MYPLPSNARLQEAVLSLPTCLQLGASALWLGVNVLPLRHGVAVHSHSRTQRTGQVGVAAQRKHHSGFAGAARARTGTHSRSKLRISYHQSSPVRRRRHHMVLLLCVLGAALSVVLLPHLLCVQSRYSGFWVCSADMDVIAGSQQPCPSNQTRKDKCIWRRSKNKTQYISLYRDRGVHALAHTT